MENRKKIVMILGPTASGKTACAVRLAERIRAEILSADSRQIYRGMDIGSGKDAGEYCRADGTRIPVHLLDVADPAGPVFTLADYLLAANRTVEDIAARGKIPLIVGGSALYLHGLLKGYRLRGGPPSGDRERLRQLPLGGLQEELRRIDPADPVLAKEPENRTRLIRRIEMRLGSPDAVNEKEAGPETDREFLILGVLRDRKAVHAAIERRLDARLADGMLEEAQRLHAEGVSWEKMEFFGLEYRYMALHLQGKLTFRDMRDQLLCRIRQFAKRQDSWFRKMEKEGYPVYWLPGDGFADAAEPLVRRFLADEALPEPEIRLSEIHYGRPAGK